MNPDRAVARLTVRYLDNDGADRRVPAEQAASIRFEDCPPVRAIPSFPGQDHTPGRYWSASTGGLVAYESFLECQWLTLLDFDPTVTAITTQALELHGADAEGRWRHVPDVFTRRSDGTAWVVDVKNPKHLADPTVVRQAERTAAACRMLGWDYTLVGAPPTQRHANIAWLAGYRRPLRAGAARIETVLVRATRPMRLGELLADDPAPALARPVIFHLLWHHMLVCDLDTPLRDYSVVSLAAASTQESAAASPSAAWQPVSWEAAS